MIPINSLCQETQEIPPDVVVLIIVIERNVVLDVINPDIESVLELKSLKTAWMIFSLTWDL